MVEFAIAAPILLALVIGVITASYLYFDQQALDDATRSAARAALVSTSLYTTNAACLSGQGESGLPTTISSAAQYGATVAIRVNPGPLCATTVGTLDQAASQPSDVVIAVAGTPDLTHPTQITVTGTATVHPLSLALGIQLTLTSRSTLTTQ